MKNAITFLTLTLSIFVTIPIWVYLQYKVLVMVGATDLMWFLFWVYVPAAFVATALGNLLKAMTSDD